MALARRALEAGAHGVAAYVPWFYPVTPEQVRGHFLALLEAAGDAPAFIYNIPPRTVNDLSPELAGELARAGFAGMKDSTGDLERQLQYLAAVDSSFEVYTGTEPLIVESVAAGAAGSINGLSNCRPELFVALREALAAGDDVTELHEEISALKQQVKAEGTVPARQAAGPRAARRARGRLPRRSPGAVRVTRVVTAGETMALLDPEREGELELGDRLRLRFAGAESNFAIALARLEVPVAWISRLGADRLGVLIHETLRAEGVDVRWVRTDDDAPTGLFYKWRADGRTSVAYHRRGSAASRMEPADVPHEALEGASLVHLTGITMALGDGPRELVLDVARRARQAGAIVTFDPNYRPALWDSPAAAAAAMEPVLEHVDWYLCGAEEADGAGHGRPAAGGRPDGARSDARGERIEVPAAVARTVVDEIGAGDAFAAGFAYGLLQGRPPRAAVEAAHAVAAWALRGTGDWETLPRRRDVFPGLGLLLAVGLGRFLVGDHRRPGADRLEHLAARLGLGPGRPAELLLHPQVLAGVHRAQRLVLVGHQHRRVLLADGLQVAQGDLVVADLVRRPLRRVEAVDAVDRGVDHLAVVAEGHRELAERVGGGEVDVLDPAQEPLVEPGELLGEDRRAHGVGDEEALVVAHAVAQPGLLGRLLDRGQARLERLGGLDQVGRLEVLAGLRELVELGPERLQLLHERAGLRAGALGHLLGGDRLDRRLGVVDPAHHEAVEVDQVDRPAAVGDGVVGLAAGRVDPLDPAPPWPP